jgi:hypothetical protein
MQTGISPLGPTNPLCLGAAQGASSQHLTKGEIIVTTNALLNVIAWVAILLPLLTGAALVVFSNITTEGLNTRQKAGFALAGLGLAQFLGWNLACLLTGQGMRDVIAQLSAYII